MDTAQNNSSWASELREMTMVIGLVIVLALAFVIAWAVTLVAWLCSQNFWRVPRVGKTLRRVRERAYDWLLAVSILGAIALVLITLGSVANYHYGNDYYGVGSAWWGETVAKFFGL